MGWTNDELWGHFDKTDGQCHICRDMLVFANYGVHGARGAWHVDHSNPRARGGTDRNNNLLPACITCNLRKGAKTTRSARAVHGYKKAPMSAAKREAVREGNAFKGAGVGGVIGGLLGGPFGALVGAVFGAVAGNSQDPEE